MSQATNIALNNLSLVLISLSLNQVIRCAGFYGFQAWMSQGMSQAYMGMSALSNCPAWHAAPTYRVCRPSYAVNPRS